MAKKSDVQDNRTDPTPAQPDEERPFRTGPNVDAGLEPGAVTIDPATAEGVAAEAAREANGATVTTDDRKVIVESITDKSDDRMDDGRRIALKAENDPRVTAEA